jgi:hypothetical protein
VHHHRPGEVSQVSKQDGFSNEQNLIVTKKNLRKLLMKDQTKLLQGTQA